MQLTKIVNQFTLRWVRLRIFWCIYLECYRESKKPVQSYSSLTKLLKKYQESHGSPINKIVKVGNRYFWRIVSPGFPSPAYNKLLNFEAKRLMNGKQSSSIRIVFLAITSKCPLKCEHCFEWDLLNHKETFSDTDLINIVKEYQSISANQIYLSGGEPLLRFNSIIKILEHAKAGTDFWIITSGLGLTLKKAQELKAAGLTGVMVSLDNHNPEKHNKFRGYQAAFDQATKAVINANQVGIVTSLSLCATPEFVNDNNLNSYMNLAHDLGVAFVQILEVRATGRYKNNDAQLSREQIQSLEDLFIRYNNHRLYKKYPIIDYPGYHQRRVGCFGAGDRFFYIDSSGHVHVCPFCSKQICKVTEHSAADTIKILNTHNCHQFQPGVF